MSSFWCCLRGNLSFASIFFSLRLFSFVCLSICQSIHLFDSICHFSCHLNHQSIRPSIFQATHLSMFQCIPSSFIRPSCLLCTVTLYWLPLWSPRLSAELWWQIWSRKWSSEKKCLHAYTQIRPNTPVCGSVSHDLMYLLFSPYVPGELLQSHTQCT